MLPLLSDRNPVACAHCFSLPVSLCGPLFILPLFIALQNSKFRLLVRASNDERAMQAAHASTTQQRAAAHAYGHASWGSIFTIRSLSCLRVDGVDPSLLLFVRAFERVARP